MMGGKVVNQVGVIFQEFRIRCIVGRNTNWVEMSKKKALGWEGAIDFRFTGQNIVD